MTVQLKTRQIVEHVMTISFMVRIKYLLRSYLHQFYTLGCRERFDIKSGSVFQNLLEFQKTYDEAVFFDEYVVVDTEGDMRMVFYNEISRPPDSDYISIGKGMISSMISFMLLHQYVFRM